MGSCGNLHAQCPRIVRSQCRACLFGDQVRSADPGFDDHHAGAGQPEIPTRGSLRNDDGAKQLRPAGRIAEDADHQVDLVADGDRRQPLDTVDTQALSGIGAKDGHPVRPIGMAGIRQASGFQYRSDGAEHVWRAGTDREPKALWFSGSFTGDELTSALPTSTSLTVPAATTPFKRRSRAGASHGSASGIDDARRGAGPCGDEQLGRGELVELADDAVSGGAGQAHCRHQRRHPDHDAQHGQDHASRPAKIPASASFRRSRTVIPDRGADAAPTTYRRQGDRPWR